jgi:hypothetical protein
MNEAITDVSLIVASTPAIVFTDPKKAEQFFAHIEAEVEGFVPDLTTVTGRKAIASLAYKVAQTKTAIDAAGAELNEDARKRIDAVDAERRKFRARLDELKDRARKPLTDWEVAEEARVAECKRIVAMLADAVVVTVADTAATLQQRWEATKDLLLDPAALQDYLPIAEATRDSTLAALDSAFTRLIKEEADRAELEQLRAAEAERKRREAEAAEAARLEEERAFAARVEEQRRAKAMEDADRHLAEAAEQARREAEERAEAERLATERRHAEELAAAERERQALIEEQARKDREREAEAKRIAAEDATRAADRAHRGKVMEDAALAIMEAGKIGRDKADKIALAIGAGQVPNVKLTF